MFVDESEDKAHGARLDLPEVKMRWLAMLAIAAACCSHARAQRPEGVNFPDTSRMPLYHARHDGTLFCGTPDSLLYMRSEVGPGPVDRTKFTYAAKSVCSTIPSKIGLSMWHEYRYNGISGQANGPRFMQVSFNDRLVGYVMSDDLVPAVTTIYPH